MKRFYLFLITITICIATSKPACSIEPNQTDEKVWEVIDANVAQVAAAIADSFSCEDVDEKVED